MAYKKRNYSKYSYTRIQTIAEMIEDRKADTEHETKIQRIQEN